jgi:hypothetical protein
MRPKALVGYETVFGHNYPRCQDLTQILSILDTEVANNTLIDPRENPEGRPEWPRRLRSQKRLLQAQNDIGCSEGSM